MLKRFAMQSALVAASLFVLMPAAVAQGSGPVYSAPMMTNQGMGQVFQGRRWEGFGRHMGTPAIIDQNGDGVVQPDEAAARSEGRFGAYDADDDGMVVKDEFMAVRMRGGPRGQLPKYSTQEAKFAGMDANKDGKVSKAEFITAGERQYMKSDSNGDGKVTVWEYRAARGVK
ncbi:MAG: hypothetical protein HOM25_10395 [Rhodospirillaceae bacterium]|nr:hypothetical protein [Rhodospirillaceae bacterium]MBT5664786.1 hypothetical protein [Rhodospirillaceae bacterium]